MTSASESEHKSSESDFYTTTDVEVEETTPTKQHQLETLSPLRRQDRNFSSTSKTDSDDEKTVSFFPTDENQKCADEIKETQNDIGTTTLLTVL